MRVLLDNNVDPRYARLLPGHDISHARKMKWAELENGQLIAAAEGAKFDVVVTTDKNMQYQQNLTGRKISIIVLNSRLVTWPNTEPLAPQVLKALADLPPSSFITINPESQA